MNNFGYINTNNFAQKDKWLNHKNLVIKPFLASLNGFEPLTCRSGASPDRSTSRTAIG